MAQTTTTPETQSSRLGYQPALDGVRAIAITLVLLYHFPWADHHVRVGGGFLGVDVFFVLSGFLITTLLLQEHSSLGRVSIRRFYARRALRLLPAFAVLWTTALILHFTLADNFPFRPRTTGLVGALFYGANWVSIYRPGMLGMIGHTWSLAIEEQFYFVWPVILVLLLRRKLQLPTIAVITAVGALSAAAYRAAYWHSHVSNASFVNFYFRATSRPISNRGPGTHAQRVFAWDRLYYGSDTRADALLVGCFTAMVLILVLSRLDARARSRLSAAAGAAFVVGGFIVSRAVMVQSGWLPQWGFLTLELCVAFVIAGLVAAPGAALARVLSLPPFVWMGRRSYAIYLYHFPIFLYFNRIPITLSAPVSFVAQFASVFLAAELSHRLIEAPMLRLKQRFEPAFATPARQ